MMLRIQIKNWVQSVKWFYGFLISTGVLLICYLVVVVISEVRPGNLWGIIFGILSAVLMLGVALFGVRRRTVKFLTKFPLGRAQTWVQFHVYAGTLFLLLMFLHTGFRFPIGSLTGWIYWLSIWVTISGILGVFLQKTIPKILTSGLSIEVLHDRIPGLIEEIRGKTEELIEPATDTLTEFYHKKLAPVLVGPQPRLIYYLDITGGIQSHIKQFEHVRKLLSSEEIQKLNEIEACFKTKLELDAHYTLQKPLRWWLYLHVPVSIVLVLLVLLHIFSIIYY